MDRVICAFMRAHSVTQLHPTLCNPMNCRPPGSSVLGILQARHWKVKVKVIQSCLTLCDPMHCIQAASSAQGFSSQEYQSGLPFPFPGDLPNPGSNPGLPHCRQILYLLSHYKNTGAGCYFLLQGIIPMKESNPCLLQLLHRQWDSLPLSQLRSPRVIWMVIYLHLYIIMDKDWE